MSFKVGDKIVMIEDCIITGTKKGKVYKVYSDCGKLKAGNCYHSDLWKLVKGRGRPKKEKSIKFIVFYDETDGDPAKKFISRKELVNWIKEAKEDENIVFDSIEVYPAGERLEVKIKTNVSLRKSGR